MGVSVEASLGVPVCSIITGQVPDDKRLVATGGEEHIGANNMSVFRTNSRRSQGIIE